MDYFYSTQHAMMKARNLKPRGSERYKRDYVDIAKHVDQKTLEYIKRFVIKLNYIPYFYC